MIDVNCERCFKPFRVWPYILKMGRGRFCSKLCFDGAQTGQQNARRPLADRFWEKVDKRGPDECWLWTGSRNRDGYGSIGRGGGDGFVAQATHVAWEVWNGAPFPPGMLACHTCDNPPCVNPAHLFVGTKSDNATDMARKGRSIKGQHRAACRNGHARTAANTYVHRRGVACRICRAIREGPTDVVIALNGRLP